MEETLLSLTLRPTLLCAPPSRTHTVPTVQNIGWAPELV
jgi:hypothetical protein